MNLPASIPGMEPESTERNVVVGILYVALLPVVVALIPIVVGVVVGQGRGDLGSKLEQLPGISPEGGAVAGIAAFVYSFAAVGVLGIALPTNGSQQLNASDTPTPAPTATTTTTQSGGSVTTTATQQTAAPTTTVATTTVAATTTAATATATATQTPTQTSTATATLTATQTPTSTPTPTVTATQTPTLEPTPTATTEDDTGGVVTPTPSNDPDASDPYDCGDFDTREQVEAVFDPDNDVSDLDHDSDGTPCESL